jgi:hypothetical protein
VLEYIRFQSSLFRFDIEPKLGNSAESVSRLLGRAKLSSKMKGRVSAHSEGLVVAWH